MGEGRQGVHGWLLRSLPPRPCHSSEEHEEDGKGGESRLGTRLVVGINTWFIP